MSNVTTRGSDGADRRLLRPRGTRLLAVVVAALAPPLGCGDRQVDSETDEGSADASSDEAGEASGDSSSPPDLPQFDSLEEACAAAETQEDCAAVGEPFVVDDTCVMAPNLGQFCGCQWVARAQFDVSNPCLMVSKAETCQAYAYNAGDTCAPTVGRLGNCRFPSAGFTPTGTSGRFEVRFMDEGCTLPGSEFPGFHSCSGDASPDECVCAFEFAQEICE